MKITFFLIAFCLIFMRMYLSWTGHWGRNPNSGTMVISNGDDYEVKIKWSGKVRFNADETAIASITPGGYLRYTFNDKKMTAESNLQGDIVYTLYDGHETLPLNDSGKKFLVASIWEIIADGYDAEGRADRVAARGGKKALLEEAEKFKSGNIKGMYIDRLFKNDSLTRDDLTVMLTLIGEIDGDYEKEQRLKRFNPEQLKDSGVVKVWLGATERIRGDNEKKELLVRFIEKDSLSPASFDKVLEIAGEMGSDWDKGNILDPLIDKGPLDSGRFDRLLGVIDHFGSDGDKVNLYKRMIARNTMTEEEWTNLLGHVGLISPDNEKSNLLVQIAREMPRSENGKAAYLKSARTISGDQEYGKAMRAIE